MDKQQNSQAGTNSDSTSRVSALRLPSPQALLSQFARDTYVICPGVIALDQARAMRDTALALVAQHARRIQHESPENTLRYRVVTGETVRADWPELFALYGSDELRSWVASIAGVPKVFTSSHVRSAININAMGEPGEIYRWHTDAAGFTVLLYLTDSAPEDGGALELRVPGSRETRSMLPARGTLVLMDGTRCMHRVSPILRPHERISIPMVFTPNQDAARPPGLDDYLYT